MARCPHRALLNELWSSRGLVGDATDGGCHTRQGATAPTIGMVPMADAFTR